jgi:hypothetical protein
VASVGHLIAVKLLARSPQRLQDEVDLDALGRVASGADLDEARAAVRLITTRGFARDSTSSASSTSGASTSAGDASRPRSALPVRARR